MKTTFAASSNTSTNGVALANPGDDVRVFKLIIGTPVNSGNVWLYNITNPVASATTNIAFKTTLPSSIPTTGASLTNVFDFGPFGLPLQDGGNLVIDQTMNVTVMWELADNAMP